MLPRDLLSACLSADQVIRDTFSAVFLNRMSGGLNFLFSNAVVDYLCSPRGARRSSTRPFRRILRLSQRDC